MKKIFIVILFVPLLVVGNTALAHGDDTSGSGTGFDCPSGGMMGVDCGQWQDFEHNMMSDEEHERMEELMTDFYAGELSEEGEQEMAEMMQDEQLMPGAMAMMNRLMYNSNNPEPQYGYGHMAGYGMDWSYPGLFMWVTMILLWTFLVGATVAVWKWLLINKKK